MRANYYALVALLIAVSIALSIALSVATSVWPLVWPLVSPLVKSGHLTRKTDSTAVTHLVDQQSRYTGLRVERLCHYGAPRPLATKPKRPAG